MNSIRKAVLLTRELGVKQLVPFAAYQLRLRSGALLRETPVGGWKSTISSLRAGTFAVPFFNPAAALKSDNLRSSILNEANEILSGTYHPFGGSAASLTLALRGGALQHWTKYDSTFAGTDIKFIWEAARFTWAYPLVSAALITGEERYAAFYWQKFDQFIQSNPVNEGPNWASAQEVALRLLPVLFAWQSLQGFSSTTTDREDQVKRLVEQSARRITASLDYARSQNNNHLLSEALGLIAAGTFLKGHHPQAEQWALRGFQEFEQALLNQIEPDGTYSQHSTNYHRMLLQLALVYLGYAQSSHHAIKNAISERLSAATRWLMALTDTVSGKTPNLGHNDGTLLLPLGASNYADFRPTVQAASLAFLHQPAFPPGDWDALARFLGLPLESNTETLMPGSQEIPGIARVGKDGTWGSLRAVQFHSRPAHADQLCVDLWWEGRNIAMDAGSYLYNAAPPWENSLAGTSVHNTLSINGRDQMQRAGKFLWLDRVNATRLASPDLNTVSASIDWHTHPPIRHTRRLTFLPGSGFSVIDELVPLNALTRPIQAELQWLLPDWNFVPWKDGIALSQQGLEVSLKIEALSPNGTSPTLELSLIRAGKSLLGDIESPIRGWVSPTYGCKLPALSLAVKAPLQTSLTFITTWKLNPLL